MSVFNHCKGLSPEEQRKILKTLGLNYWFEESTPSCVMVDVEEIIQWIHEVLLTDRPSLRASGDTIVMWIRWREGRKLSSATLLVVSRGRIYKKWLTKKEIAAVRRKLRAAETQ